MNAGAVRPDRRRMAVALLLSLLIHALLFSLTVGTEGPGLGFALPWQDRRVEAPELRVMLVPARIDPSKEPAASSTTAPGPPTLPPAEPTPHPPSGAPLALGVPASPSTTSPEADPPDAAPAPTSAVGAATQDVQPPVAQPTGPSTASIARLDLIALDRSLSPAWKVLPPMAAVPSPAAVAVAAPASSAPAPEPAPQSLAPTVEAKPRVDPAIEVARQASALEDARKLGAAKAAAERLETTRRDDARREAMQEAARQDALEAEAIRHEALRQEAERREAARLEAAKQEASRLETAKADNARREAERRQAAQREAEQQDAARQQAASAEAARREGERQSAAREAAAKAEAARSEADRQQAAQEVAKREDRREERLQALGRQMKEEADRRDAAARATRPPSTLPQSLGSARRGRLFGRTDTNAELVLYAEAWARKIQLNVTLDGAGEAAKRPHADPLVTVALRRDGSVESVTFVLSSGVPDIDDAIRRIVQAQAPYQPFTPALARDYDVIEIPRTWYFDTAIRLY